MNPAHDAAIGIGANLGDAAGSVRAAFDALAALPDSALVAASPLYRSAAWGVTAQPDFVNAVARVRTALAPERLLAELLAIEARRGRVRSGDRWGPRTLDLDLLLYADRRIELPGLRVPHPHLHERAFALRPLLDVWPDAAIPGVGAAADALRGLDATGVEPLAGS